MDAIVAEADRLRARVEELEPVQGRVHWLEVHLSDRETEHRAALHQLNSQLAERDRRIGQLKPLAQRLQEQEAALAQWEEKYAHALTKRDAEIARLTRLLDDGGQCDLTPVDLDTVLAPLVISHRARGRIVAWRRSALTALGRSDDLAEAVNVLLENAACHGSADDISVTVRQTGRSCEIAVSDGGDGVPEELRSAIFEWGRSRADSPGHGIGLNVARELVAGIGGELRLDELSRRTRFVITLPLARAAWPATEAPDLARAG